MEKGLVPFGKEAFACLHGMKWAQKKVGSFHSIHSSPLIITTLLTYSNTLGRWFRCIETLLQRRSSSSAESTTYLHCGRWGMMRVQGVCPVMKISLAASAASAKRLPGCSPSNVKFMVAWAAEVNEDPLCHCVKLRRCFDLDAAEDLSRVLHDCPLYDTGDAFTETSSCCSPSRLFASSSTPGVQPQTVVSC